MFDAHLVAKAASVILTGGALACGLRALRFTSMAADVPVDPGYIVEPGIAELTNMYWTAAAVEAAAKSSDLSRRATPWLTWSVWLGAASAVVGMFG